MFNFRKRFWLLLTILILLSLILAACGGDDESEDNDDGDDNQSVSSNPDDAGSNNGGETTETDPLADSDLLPLDLTETYTFESGASFQYPGQNWFLFDDDTVQEGVVISYQGGEERAANGVVLDQEELVVILPDAASLDDIIRGYVSQSPLWPTANIDGTILTERTTPDGRQMLYTSFADSSNNEVLIIGVDLGNGNRGLMYWTSTAQEHPADIEEALLQVAETFTSGG